jgi:hypothetical protein
MIYLFVCLCDSCLSAKRIPTVDAATLLVFVVPTYQNKCVHRYKNLCVCVTTCNVSKCRLWGEMFVSGNGSILEQLAKHSGSRLGGFGYRRSALSLRLDRGTARPSLTSRVVCVDRKPGAFCDDNSCLTYGREHHYYTYTYLHTPMSLH